MKAIVLFCVLSAAALILPIHAVISNVSDFSGGKPVSDSVAINGSHSGSADNDIAIDDADTYPDAAYEDSNGDKTDGNTAGGYAAGGNTAGGNTSVDSDAGDVIVGEYDSDTGMEGLGNLIVIDNDNESVSDDDTKYESGGGTDSEQSYGRDLPKENIIVSINAVGDCTIGYDETFGYQGRFDQVYESQGYDPAYFFSNVLDEFNKGDITVANLEGVFTESNQKADKAYRFKGPPDYVKILEAGGIDGVCVANNHVYDYFERGFNDTKAALDNSTVAYFGYETYKIFDIEGVLVGFAGIHAGAGGWEHRRKSVNQALETLNRDADIVVMSIHWGVEGRYQPTGDQRNLARYCIDNGADLVIGHHTHTLQGVETYNGRTVAYSLGNFCFGGNRNPKDKDTMILRQSFEFDGESLELLTVPEPEIIPVSLSSVSNRNDYMPTPLYGAEAERVLQKIADGL